MPRLLPGSRGPGLLLLLLMLGPPALGHPIPPLNLTSLPAVLRVAVVPFPPFASFDPATNTWSGYDIDLFSLAARYINLTFEFELVDVRYIASLDLALQDLRSPGAHHVVINGITLQPDLLDYGKPTRGTYKYGISSLVAWPEQEPELFICVTIFSWDLWLALGLTGVLIAAVMLALEWNHERARRHAQGEAAVAPVDIKQVGVVVTPRRPRDDTSC